MPRINHIKCVELLEELHSMTQMCWEISKNPELTELLEKMMERLEQMVKTIEDALG
jgi:hypothetical protein